MKMWRTMGSFKRGALIVIEGVDRSGKSTQCKKLIESLLKKNIQAELMSFPDRSTLTGKLISEYLSNTECKLNDQAIHLLFSANRWENVDKMKQLLYDGTTLIVDRYSYSGVAFSSAKKGMDINWCKNPENGLPKPDLVFLLTLTPEEMEKRPGFGNERYEKSGFQKNVARMFQELCDENDDWKIIDAAGTVEQVEKKLLDNVLSKIKEVESQPLKTLEFS